MLVTPPFGASSNIALWRAYSKPPVELVVADLVFCILVGSRIESVLLLANSRKVTNNIV